VAAAVAHFVAPEMERVNAPVGGRNVIVTIRTVRRDPDTDAHLSLRSRSVANK